MQMLPQLWVVQLWLDQLDVRTADAIIHGFGHIGGKSLCLHKSRGSGRVRKCYGPSIWTV